LQNSNASSPELNRLTHPTFHSNKTEIRSLKTQTEMRADLIESKFQTPPIYRIANNSPTICHARTLLITPRPTNVQSTSKAPNTQEINKRKPTPQKARKPSSQDNYKG